MPPDPPPLPTRASGARFQPPPPTSKYAPPSLSTYNDALNKRSEVKAASISRY